MKTLNEMFAEAVRNRFVFVGIDEWMLSDADIYPLADFIGAGGAPAWYKKEDADAAAALAREISWEFDNSPDVVRIKRGDKHYWTFA